MDESVVRARLTDMLTGNATDVAARVDRAMSEFDPAEVIELPGGWAWSKARSSERQVRGADFDVEQVAEAGRRLRAAYPEGFVFSSYLGDRVSTALATELQPELVATRMGLAVADVPTTDAIELRPMTEQQFDAFMATELEHYAESLYGAGGFATMDDARARSREQHDELLPDGLATKGHHLWSAYEPGVDEPVGVLWIADDDNFSFIYDIAVDDAHQGKGHGTAMLRAGAAAVRDSGRDSLWLNVFGHNSNARRLYEREGYAVNEEIWRVAAS